MAAEGRSIRKAARSVARDPAAVPRVMAQLPALPPELVEACRFASLQLGGPRLASLGVTSSVRGEGRSTLVRALAHIQSEDYQRSVVLVDLDLERPSLGGWLGANGCPGMADLAEGRVAVDDALQQLGGGIALVTAGSSFGPVARTMAAILRSEVLSALGERFDVVIADLPPLLGSGLGRAPAGAFTDLLLVVRSGVTPLGRIREATAHLPVPPAVVLNGTRSHLPPWVRRLAGC